MNDDRNKLITKSQYQHRMNRRAAGEVGDYERFMYIRNTGLMTTQHDINEQASENPSVLPLHLTPGVWFPIWENGEYIGQVAMSEYEMFGKGQLRLDDYQN